MGGADCVKFGVTADEEGAVGEEEAKARGDIGDCSSKYLAIASSERSNFRNLLEGSVAKKKI
jgi:hypothetical protein